MSAFPGEFYFKLTVHGNLLGEFTNRAEEGICTESAVRVTAVDPEDKGGFTGTYKTTWYDREGPGTGDLANLKIDFERGVDGEPKSRLRYELIWTDAREGNRRFHGHGFVCEGKLIGSYVGC